MATNDPVRIKSIGRAINSGEDDWNKDPEASAAMFNGLLHKFQQSSYLSKLLLSTGDDILAEANPRDCTWGIGLHKDDPKALIRDEWLGDNQLGDLLMTVRYRLTVG